MTPLSPDAELRAAAERLRGATFRGAITMTPVVAALVAAREPLAKLLDSVAEQVNPDAGPSWQEALHGPALAVARALNHQETP